MAPKQQVPCLKNYGNMVLSSARRGRCVQSALCARGAATLPPENYIIIFSKLQPTWSHTGDLRIYRFTNLLTISEKTQASEYELVVTNILTISK